ncbi:MAG: DUF6868 family protein [Desulforhopalus sp.]
MMDTEVLKKFFLWCIVVNGCIFLFWTLFLLFTPDLVYKIQYHFFPIPRDAYDVVIYAFLGLFKIFFLIFNVVPYISLRLITR